MEGVKITEKSPWRPWVSGIYGVLFGPLAAGMVTSGFLFYYKVMMRI